MSATFRDSSSRVLEFDQFRDLLAAYIGSSLGKVRVSKLAPTTDRDWIVRQQQLAEEARQFYAAGGRFEFSGLFDAHSLLAKSRIAGAVLELDELRDLVLMADKAAEWREVALNPSDSIRVEWNAMSELAQTIADFAPLLRYFSNKILPDGTLDDRASPELSRIRRKQQGLHWTVMPSKTGAFPR